MHINKNEKRKVEVVILLVVDNSKCVRVTNKNGKKCSRDSDFLLETAQQEYYTRESDDETSLD